MNELRGPYVETVRGSATFWEAGATPNGIAWGKAKIDGKKVQAWRFKFGTTELNPDFDTLKQACADGALVMAEVYCRERNYTYKDQSGVTTDRTINVIQVLDANPDASEGGESQPGSTDPTSSGSTPSPAAATEPRAGEVQEMLGEIVEYLIALDKKLDRLLTPGNGAQGEPATAPPSAATNTAVEEVPL